MAFPAYQSSALANAAGASASPSKPTGLAVGDLMFAIVSALGGTGDIPAPAGWTRISQESPTAGYVAALFVKLADANDVAASSFTFTATGASLMKVGLVRVSTDNPNSLYDHETSASWFTGSPTISGFTPSVGNGLFMVFAAWADANSHSASSYAMATDNPSSWTEAFDSDSGSGPHCGVAMGYASRGKTTATGTPSVSIGTATSGGFLFMFFVNVIPAVPTPLAISVGEPRPITPVFPSTLHIATSVGMPTVVDEEPEWTNEDKHSSTSWDNVEKH